MLRTLRGSLGRLSGAAGGSRSGSAMLRGLSSSSTSTNTTNTSRSLAIRGAQNGGSSSNALITVAERRRAETRRFGLPVINILMAGLVSVASYVYWLSLNKRKVWVPPQPAPQLMLSSLVSSQEDVEALMSEVRFALEKFGISFGQVHLPCHIDHAPHEGGLSALRNRYVEGATWKVYRRPPQPNGISAVVLRPGMTAINAARVLAHEYTHCWLHLQRFPPLRPRLEEGLCELLSYLYLLSLLNDDGQHTAGAGGGGGGGGGGCSGGDGD